MDELLRDFLVETGEHVEAVASQLVLFERDPLDTRIIANIYRLVHTIKGTCGFLDLPRLEAVAHAAESLIARLRDGAPPTREAVSLILEAVDRVKAILTGIEASASEPPGDDSRLIADLVSLASGVKLRQPDNDVWVGPGVDETAPDVGRPDPAPPTHGLAERRTETVRVSVGTLERLMALVSELVLTRNQLLDRAWLDEESPLKAPLQRLISVTGDLQHSVMKARMQPVGRLFSNLPRLVRDVSAELGRNVEIRASGGDTELDRQLIAIVRDPLTHMIRNSIGHGIEPPEERVAAGKPATGVITVRAYHDAGHIAIEVSDDGRGLDTAMIRLKAVAKGLVRQAEAACLTDADVYRFIFAPGFSTAASITNVYGRGIGMDVVRANIEAIGGTVSVATQPGVGTTFLLKIPLTLAIAPALIVHAGEERYALPHDAVIEVCELGEETGVRVEKAQGAPVLRTAAGVLPALCLREALGLLKEGAAAPQFAVTMRVGANLFAILVEDVAEVLEIVVKPLPAIVSGLGIFSGNTITGDGRIVLILDPAGLAARLGIARNDTFPLRAAADGETQVETTRIVLFRNGEGQMQALPLSLVQRIDSLRPEAIEMIDGGAVLRQGQRLLPIAPLREGSRGAGRKRPSYGFPLLVIGAEPETVGLVVDEIVDIFDDRLVVALDGRGGDVAGSAIVRGETVEIPDVGRIVSRARGERAPLAARGRGPIVVADASAFFRDMLGGVLAAAGHEIVATANAPAAREALAARDCAAFVCDERLAPRDGCALAGELRSDPRFARLPIILMSAYATADAKARAAACGADAAIGKFDRPALIDALTRALAERAGAPVRSAA